MNQTTKPERQSWENMSLGEKVGAAVGILIVSVALIALATLVFGSIQPDPTCYACEARDSRDFGASGR